VAVTVRRRHGPGLVREPVALLAHFFQLAERLFLRVHGVQGLRPQLFHDGLDLRRRFQARGFDLFEAFLERVALALERFALLLPAVDLAPQYVGLRLGTSKRIVPLALQLTAFFAESRRFDLRVSRGANPRGFDRGQPLAQVVPLAGQLIDLSLRVLVLLTCLVPLAGELVDLPPRVLALLASLVPLASQLAEGLGLLLSGAALGIPRRTRLLAFGKPQVLLLLELAVGLCALGL
jgi:hypothetical protein